MRTMAERGGAASVRSDVLLRLLSRFDAALLQRQCGHALAEELREVKRELDEVLGANKRLQEVREAVASLESGRSDVGRNANVMETAESVARVQQALVLRLRTLEKLMEESEVVKTEKKSDSGATKKRLLLVEENEKGDDDDGDEEMGQVGEEEDAETEEEEEEEEEEEVREPVTKKQKKEVDEPQKNVIAQIAKEKNVQTGQEFAESVERVKKTKQGAKRLLSMQPRDRPMADITDLVDNVCSVILEAPMTDVSGLNKITSGHFKLLLIKTQSILKQMQEVDPKAVELRRAASAFEKALEKHPQLMESLNKPPKSKKKSVGTGVEEWEGLVVALVEQLEMLVPRKQLITPSEVLQVVKSFEAVAEKGTSKDKMLKGLLTQNRNGNAAVPHLFTATGMIAALLKRTEVNDEYLPLLGRVRTTIDKLVAVDKKKLKSLFQHKNEICNQTNRIVLSSAKARAGNATKAPHATEQPSYAPFKRELSMATKLKNSAPSKKRSSEMMSLARTLHKELETTFPMSGKAKPSDDMMIKSAALAIDQLVALACEQPLADDSRSFFQDFLEHLFAMRARHPAFQHLNSKARDMLYDHLYITETAAKKSGKNSSGTTSNAGNKDCEVFQTLEEATREINSWDGNIFSIKQFDAALKKVRYVMEYKSSTWDVRRDVDVLKCLKLMQNRVEAIAKKEHRHSRAVTLTGWIKQMKVK